jgi:hypothetical protein
MDITRLEVGLVYLDEGDLLMDVALFFRGGWKINEAGALMFRGRLGKVGDDALLRLWRIESQATSTQKSW